MTQEAKGIIVFALMIIMGAYSVLRNRTRTEADHPLVPYLDDYLKHGGWMPIVTGTFGLFIFLLEALD